MSKETKEIRPARAGVRPWGFTDMESLFDRILATSWLRPFPRPFLEFGASGAEPPLIDVYEEKDDLVVKAEMPGLDKNDIDVSVTGRTLTIRGEKKKEEETRGKEYYRCERSFGAFSRSIDLPSEVKTDNVKASFRNGVLEVRLPRTEEAKNNVVHVKVA
jgi:HSP20 family protein